MRIITIPETGQKVNCLTILGPAFSLDGHLHVVVECECGETKVINYYNVRKGLVKSCGCLSKKASSERMRRYNSGKPVGQNYKSRHPLYRLYKAMVARCYNPKNKAYDNYGGRGIKICGRWLGASGFENFVADMGAFYAEGLLIERVDNDGDYCPENCTWADRFVQNSNTRKTVKLSYQGKTLTLSQWSRELGIGRDVLCRRRKRGLTAEQILAPIKSDQKRGNDGRWVKRN